MEPTRYNARGELLRALIKRDVDVARRVIEENVKREPELWRNTARSILASDPPLSCAEVRDCIVEFAVLSPEEAAELMPDVQGHVEFCDECQGALELQRRTDIRLPDPPSKWPEPRPGGEDTRGRVDQPGPFSEVVRLYGQDEPDDLPYEPPPGDRLILNRERTAWVWAKDRSPLREGQQQGTPVGEWHLLQLPAFQTAAVHLGQPAPPISVAIMPPGLGIEVRVLVTPPPPLGENRLWRIRFEADERPDVKLWVALHLGESGAAATYQILPGGTAELEEVAPSEQSYFAGFEWESPAGPGEYAVEIPFSQEA